MAILATIEVTDTFAGEANYCWVRRASIESEGLTDRQIIRRLKDKAGLAGVRCRLAYDCGDIKRYDVDNACMCFFVNFGVESDYYEEG